MDIFDVLSFIGGISLFLFGMSVMSKSLEKTAGGKLKNIVYKMTSNKFLGLLTGLLVTAIIQSSSATTVMVVGFVNSGIMNLSQAIGVIMGANIGTTVTSWILSLVGISSSNVFISLFKPSSFSPILALVGIILYMFSKSEKKKDVGMILLGFATLMFGMETMSSAVSGLKSEEWFRNLFIMFEDNPLLGVLVGTVVTAIIQSSSASIGILQAFTLTGQISYGAATPIILGQNIGTCITAILSSIGTNKNAKRASIVHLLFNVIGTAIALVAYLIVWKIFNPAILSETASIMGIAVIHSSFNIICTVLLFPFSGLLEKLACMIIPDKQEETVSEIDERLLNTPSIALNQVKVKINEMSNEVFNGIQATIDLFKGKDNFEYIRESESKIDHYDHLISNYLIKLSAKGISEEESKSISTYLKTTTSLERISDHYKTIAKLNKQLKDEGITLSNAATKEIDTCLSILKEMSTYINESIINVDSNLVYNVDSLKHVLDALSKTISDNHIKRVQKEECTIDKGFILAELLSHIVSISNAYSDIAQDIIDNYDKKDNLNNHSNELFDEYYSKYVEALKA